MAEASTEIATIRREITTAQERGDQKLAQQLYGRSLELQQAALATPQAAGQTASPEVQQQAQALVDARETVEATITRLRRAGYDEHEIELLRRDWPGDLAIEHLAVSRAVATDHPRLVEIVEQHGVSEVAALRLAAEVGKAMGYRWTAPGAAASAGSQPATARQPGAGGAAVANQLEFDREHSRRRAEIEQLQAQGKNALANAAYVELQNWLRQQGHDQPIVNGRRVA